MEIAAEWSWGIAGLLGIRIPAAIVASVAIRLHAGLPGGATIFRRCRGPWPWLASSPGALSVRWLALPQPVASWDRWGGSWGQPRRAPGAAVPAYPTTYAASPASYTSESIIRGANLYAQNCDVCHGPYGRGDGPAAASLAKMPADLAAHASSHRVGELFWWVAHGIPGTPMPGFTSLLSSAEIWDLVQFLRAQADAAAATTLTGRAQPWRSAIVAPDFTFELPGQNNSH
jgi:mono/diheme cytochrome c family protein